MELYKTTEWESGSGLCWYVEDVSPAHLGKVKSPWIIPSRILNIPIDQFLILIMKKYNASIHCNKDYSFVGWSFPTLEKARAYKNWINKKAREVNFRY